MANKPKTNATASGKDYFRVRARIGEDNKGNPVYKNFYGSSKSDAEKKKREYLDEIAQGVNPELGKQSLSKAMHIWLWQIERYNGNKSSTFERYEGVYRNYIENKTIGYVNVSDIKKITVQQYYNELLFKEGKSITQVTVLHKLLNKFLRYAESETYIAKNPLKGLKLPKPSEDEINNNDKPVETFTQNEIKKIIDAAGHTKIRYLITFALFTGAREGEILALDKADIKDNIININKTLKKLKIFDDVEGTKYHYELKVTKPKTKNSTRDLTVNNALKKELKGLNKLIAEERLKLGPLYTENNLLFPSSVGTYILAKSLITSWQRLLKRAGVEYKKFHALRHTFATTLIMENVDILTVSRLLGHSSIETTQIYTHVLKERKNDALSVLNDKFI